MPRLRRRMQLPMAAVANRSSNSSAPSYSSKRNRAAEPPTRTVATSAQSGEVIRLVLNEVLSEAAARVTLKRWRQQKKTWSRRGHSHCGANARLIILGGDIHLRHGSDIVHVPLHVTRFLLQ
jgi:hypothetical protein